MRWTMLAMLMVGCADGDATRPGDTGDTGDTAPETPDCPRNAAWSAVLVTCAGRAVSAEGAFDDAPRGLYMSTLISPSQCSWEITDGYGEYVGRWFFLDGQAHVAPESEHDEVHILGPWHIRPASEDLPEMLVIEHLEDDPDSLDPVLRECPEGRLFLGAAH